MRFSGFCSAIMLCVLSGLVHAESPGWAMFEKVQHAVKHYNFDTSFVVLKENQVETYRWLHGTKDEQEIEHLVPLDSSGIDILRRNDAVYYLSSERPPLITHGKNIKELPAVLFEDDVVIRKLYSAVVGSSAMMSGRSAQLLRLVALEPSRYSYWLWVDVQTGFPLTIDTMSENATLLERWLVTHLQVSPELPDSLQALLEADLPEASSSHVIHPATNNTDYTLSWLPEGYAIVPEPADLPVLRSALLNYWLLSDGLHQISVFVQKAHRLPTQAYRDGATLIYTQEKEQLGITIIGPVSVDIARKLVMAVQ